MKNISKSNATETGININAQGNVNAKETESSESLPSQNSPKLSIQNLASLKQATLELFRKSKRLIQIHSFSLDKRILSNREIELSITQLIRSSRKAKVQCLIYDEKELQGFDHRIVSLAQRFTSFIEIKIIPNDYKNTISGFYLVDQQFMLYRSNREKYEAIQFNQRQIEVKDKVKYFEDIWQQSRPASFLRSLHL